MKLVIGNQKNYLSDTQIQEFKRNFQKVADSNFILCPSSIYFHEFKNADVLLGSQNVSLYDSGANTGELSCEQLKSIGVNFSIVGHSERRKQFNETIEDTNVKIKNLLNHKMIPILCIGETKEEKDSGKTKEVLLQELEGAFKNIDNKLIDKIIIAYEPIWSIGTGVVPTNNEIEEISMYIRDFVRDNYGCATILLYGGSVNLKNIDKLNEIDIIDGYLIGGASTKINELSQIIDKCK